MAEWLSFHAIVSHNLRIDGIWDNDFSKRIPLTWHLARAYFIVPILKLLVIVFLASMIMLFLDRLHTGISLLVVKLCGRNPEKMYKWEPIKEDLEVGNSSAYPMVLVQIPMYNEKEVYQLSIGAACRLSWPADRIIVQVLDDSTDPDIKEMVLVECRKWAYLGTNIKHEIRGDRKGYKAGALKEGMKHSYVSLCDFAAIFDADFQPDPDFLRRTIPFLAHNPDIGLVQAPWDFVNSKECILTRMQEISLHYHFTLEQEVGSGTSAFFGFNGTAGVWRISAINEAGGWKDRTTVEDMDLAVRASIKGWKFLYVDDIKVKSELPSTFKAYCNQQHRWSCGPAKLFKEMAFEIATNKNLPLRRKVYLIYCFFFVRKILAHLVPFVLYCIIVPTTIFFPEVQLPQWAAFYLPLAITLLTVFSSLRSLHLLALWIPFELAMSLHRIKATIIGLLGVTQVNEWVVTEKLGDTLLKPEKVGDVICLERYEDHLVNPLLPKAPNKLWGGSRRKHILVGKTMGRIHLAELFVGLYLLVCACYNVYSSKMKDYYFVFLVIQSVVFFIMGVGYIGTFVPNS